MNRNRLASSLIDSAGSHVESGARNQPNRYIERRRVVARVVALTCGEPPPGLAHWTGGRWAKLPTSRRARCSAFGMLINFSRVGREPQALVRSMVCRSSLAAAVQ
jgi:hypothetical protein